VNESEDWWKSKWEKAAAESQALAAQITEALQLFARLEERAGGWPQEVCEAHATLSAPVSDVLASHDRRVRAEAWDEGAKWAAEECGVTGPFLAPGDNPHRAEADRIEHTNP
jgi:hypothetical protein